MRKEANSVLIAGAAGTIGSVLTRHLTGLGWRIFAGVRTTEAGRMLTSELSAVIPVEFDICDEESIRGARDEIARHTGGSGLRGLVNNAGISVDGPLELVSIPALRRQFEVNVIGQLAVTQAFLPMLRETHGRVVNIGGAAGRLALPMYGALSASKSALDSLSDALRMELKHQGVAVSYIEPGAVESQFFVKSAEAARRGGLASAAQAQRIYEKAMDSSAEALSKSRTIPPEAVVTAIVKALTVRKPASRYIVGREAKVGLRILRHFPPGLRDHILMTSLGLRGEAFVGSSTNPLKSP